MTIACGRIPGPLELKDKMTKDGSRNIVSVIDADSEEGKMMETIARPLAYGQAGGRWYTLTEVKIITGRTHQIRAHLAKAGFPVLGDAKYGSDSANRWASEKLGLNTQLLHAYKLEFEKCEEEGTLAYLQGRTIEAQLPENFRRIKEKIFGNN